MKIIFNKYPIDILLCLLWSIILIPLVTLHIEGIVRILLGLPVILFIPGYLLLFILFPERKIGKGIDSIERIALSFGLSLAIVPLIGLLLNYTPVGITLESIFFSLILAILLLSITALYRWIQTPHNKRFIIKIEFTPPKYENKTDKLLTIILVIAILLALSTLIYAVIIPRGGERFTEFYLLGPTGKATDYQTTLTPGENGSVIIGLINHEQETINYTIEIWLINQTVTINEEENQTETLYHNMWFIEKITVSLPPKEADPDSPWEPQWEHNYTYHIDRRGSFKLAFLLYKGTTDNYQPGIDYKNIAEEKLQSSYEELHLFLQIT